MSELANRIQNLNLTKEEKEELEVKFQNAKKAGFRCKYCNNKMDLEPGNDYSFMIDHVLSRKHGGTDSLNNLEFVCRTCNLLKGDKDVDWFLANLERLRKRRLKNELYKARRAEDDRTREAYRQLFQLR